MGAKAPALSPSLDPAQGAQSPPATPIQPLYRQFLSAGQLDYRQNGTRSAIFWQFLANWLQFHRYIIDNLGRKVSLDIDDRPTEAAGLSMFKVENSDESDL
ncbi:MAG: hypothetical protein KIT02_15875 [Devosia sp.]|uniref:hypothetical protein n=1 Tax=Devosia sp. TaxID=1871048 RepID=UPI0024C7EE86|nr:hypothetical protein [Devosia sp.]UYN99369.1 MAG: hypothetical protein KIT02_15875 [Devosia sp.]